MTDHGELHTRIIDLKERIERLRPLGGVPTPAATPPRTLSPIHSTYSSSPVTVGVPTPVEVTEDPILRHAANLTPSHPPIAPLPITPTSFCGMPPLGTPTSMPTIPANTKTEDVGQLRTMLERAWHQRWLKQVDLHNQLKETTHQSEEYRLQVSSLLQEVDSLRAQVNARTVSETQAVAEAVQLRAANSRRAADEQSEWELAEKYREEMNKQQQYGALQAEVMGKQQRELTAAQEANSLLECQLVQRQHQLRESEAKVEKLHTELDDSRAQIRTLAAELGTNSNKDHHAEAVEREIKRLQTELWQLTDDNRREKAVTTEFAQQLRDVETDNDRLRVQLEESQHQEGMLKHQLRELEASNQRLLEELEEVRKQSHSVTDDLNRIRSELKGLRAAKQKQVVTEVETLRTSKTTHPYQTQAANSHDSSLLHSSSILNSSEDISMYTISSGGGGHHHQLGHHHPHHQPPTKQLEVLLSPSNSNSCLPTSPTAPRVTHTTQKIVHVTSNLPPAPHKLPMDGSFSSMMSSATMPPTVGEPDMLTLRDIELCEKIKRLETTNAKLHMELTGIRNQLTLMTEELGATKTNLIVSQQQLAEYSRLEAHLQSVSNDQLQDKAMVEQLTQQLHLAKKMALKAEQDIEEERQKQEELQNWANEQQQLLHDNMLQEEENHKATKQLLEQAQQQSSNLTKQLQTSMEDNQAIQTQYERQLAECSHDMTRQQREACKHFSMCYKKFFHDYDASFRDMLTTSSTEMADAALQFCSGILAQVASDYVPWASQQQKLLDQFYMYSDLQKKQQQRIAKECHTLYTSMDADMNDKVREKANEMQKRFDTESKATREVIEKSIKEQLDFIASEQQRLQDKERSLEEQSLAQEITTRARYEQLLGEWRTDLQQDFNFMKVKLQEDRCRLEEYHGKELLRLTQERLEYERQLREQYDKEKENLLDSFNQKLQELTEKSHQSENQLKEQCKQYEEEVRSHYITLSKEKDNVKQQEAARLQTAAEIWAQVRNELVKEQRAVPSLDEIERLLERKLTSPPDPPPTGRTDYYPTDIRSDDLPRSDGGHKQHCPPSSSSFTHSGGSLSREGSVGSDISAIQRKLMERQINTSDSCSSIDQRVKEYEKHLKKRYEDRYTMLEQALSQEIDSFNKRLRNEREKYITNTNNNILPSLLSPTK